MEVCNLFFIFQKRAYSYEIGGLTAMKLPEVSKETLKCRLVSSSASMGKLRDELNAFCIMRGK